jgi:predicted PurR-regulated permease PerM
MGDQFEILTTLFQFFAFALLVVVSGVVLCILLAWWDQVIRELKPALPSKDRRRRAAIPITKIA